MVILNKLCYFINIYLFIFDFYKICGIIKVVRIFVVGKWEVRISETA